VAISTSTNLVQQEAEKKLKYKTFCTEIQRMWNMKCMIITVITGATGIITKGLKKNLEAEPGNIRQTCYKRRCTWNITHNTESTAV